MCLEGVEGRRKSGFDGKGSELRVRIVGIGGFRVGTDVRASNKFMETKRKREAQLHGERGAHNLLSAFSSEVKLSD